MRAAHSRLKSQDRPFTIWGLLPQGRGMKGMVGKGRRSPEVIAAMRRNQAVYFAAVGGAGALLSKCIKKAETVAYEDLGTEAVRRLVVEEFPVIVVIDAEGTDLYGNLSG